MMHALSLAEITPLIEGTLKGGDLFFSRVSIDTRTLEPGDLYVALVGDRFDGHEFISDAARAGACAIISEQPLEVDIPLVLVGDSRQALGRLAGINRQAFDGSVISVTGSCGKTTTRQMLATVFEDAGSVMASEGNLNNDLGVPLTLFRLSPGIDYAVIELGASGVGEIAWTGSLAKPDLGMITQASEAHLAGFGSLENIVQAKGEIIDSVAPSGTVVLNFDDAAFGIWLERAGSRRVLSVSAEGDEDADLWARDIREDTDGVAFVLDGAVEPREMRIPLPGRHNVSNALLTAAAAQAQGLEMDAVVSGLARLSALPGRLQPVALRPGVTVLDDSYNANPASMAAAVQTLSQMPGRRVAVLGDMAELGDAAEARHQAIGAEARKLGVDLLMTTGDHASAYARGFGEPTITAETPELLADRLWERLNGATSILVKGSRSAGMDRALGQLRKRNDNECFSG